MKNKLTWPALLIFCMSLSIAIGQTTKEYEFKNESAVDANDFHFEITSGAKIKNASATYNSNECFPDKVFDPPSATLDWAKAENTIEIPDGSTMKLKVELDRNSVRDISGYFTRDGVEIGTGNPVAVIASLDQINPNEGFITFTNEEPANVQLNDVIVHVDNTINPLNSNPYAPNGMLYSDVPPNFLLTPGETISFYYFNNLPNSYLSINSNNIRTNNPTEVYHEKTVFFIGGENNLLGCTDFCAVNFNPDANIDDGSCFYDPCLSFCFEIGCTDPAACNYMPFASCDDGTCEFESCITETTVDLSIKNLSVYDLGDSLEISFDIGLINDYNLYPNFLEANLSIDVIGPDAKLEDKEQKFTWQFPVNAHQGCSGQAQNNCGAGTCPFWTVICEKPNTLPIPLIIQPDCANAPEGCRCVASDVGVKKRKPKPKPENQDSFTEGIYDVVVNVDFDGIIEEVDEENNYSYASSCPLVYEGCPQLSTSININVQNQTGDNKTGFQIVFKGDVCGGLVKSWKSNAEDNVDVFDYWANGPNNTSVYYDPYRNETIVNYENQGDPVSNGEYIHFGYLGLKGLRIARMHWTPTDEPPASQDRVPINEVTIYPTNDNASITIENIVRTDATYNFTEAVGYFINYRIASYEIDLENLNFGDPEIEALPVYVLDSCLLQVDDPRYYELNIPEDIEEDEYLIIEVHTNWDLNGNTTSYLAQYEILSNKVCMPYLIIDDNPVEDGVYQAEETIYVTGAIFEGGTFKFKASDRITFNDCKIAAGANVSIETVSCPVPPPLGYCYRCEINPLGNNVVVSVRKKISLLRCSLFDKDEFWNWQFQPINEGDVCP